MKSRIKNGWLVTSPDFPGRVFEVLDFNIYKREYIVRRVTKRLDEYDSKNRALSRTEVFPLVAQNMRTKRSAVWCKAGEVRGDPHADHWLVVNSDETAMYSLGIRIINLDKGEWVLSCVLPHVPALQGLQAAFELAKQLSSGIDVPVWQAPVYGPAGATPQPTGDAWVPEGPSKILAAWREDEEAKIPPPPAAVPSKVCPRCHKFYPDPGVALHADAPEDAKCPHCWWPKLKPKLTCRHAELRYITNGEHTGQLNCLHCEARFGSPGLQERADWDKQRAFVRGPDDYVALGKEVRGPAGFWPPDKQSFLAVQLDEKLGSRAVGLFCWLKPANYQAEPPKEGWGWWEKENK